MTFSSAPIFHNDSSAFPGEGWFLYWKTSSSLWESKLQENSDSKVFIPINWSFHSDTGDDYDFAKLKPETNLKKLAEICESVGKAPLFLLPLGPLPFLPNGGIPHFLARNVAKNEQGLSMGVIDRDGHLNKIFSFFDQRVFRLYSKFIASLGRYFSEQGIAAPIWGIRPYFIQNKRLTSFFEDSSTSFEQGFSQYLQVKREDQSIRSVGAPLITNSLVEQTYKYEFMSMIEAIYIEEASSVLATNWEGVVPFCFVGAGMDECLSRLVEAESRQDYLEKIMRLSTLGMIPSTVLLPSKIKQGALHTAIKSVVENGTVNKFFNPEVYSGESEHSYHPIVYFGLYTEKNQLEPLGPLVEVLDESFPWCYEIAAEKEFTWSDEFPVDKVIIYNRPVQSLSVFHHILKYFMAGGKIIIDLQMISLDLRRKLHSFILENSLVSEKVNFKIDIERVSLGEGELLLYSSALKALSIEEQKNIWPRILSLFDILHLPVIKESGVFCYWESRSATSTELNFEEIRRVSFYNPTSYKRTTKIRPSKHFALLRVSKEQHSKMMTGSQEITVELQPEGVSSIEFGVYS